MPTRTNKRATHAIPPEAQCLCSLQFQAPGGERGAALRHAAAVPPGPAPPMRRTRPPARTTRASARNSAPTSSRAWRKPNGRSAMHASTEEARMLRVSALALTTCTQPRSWLRAATALAAAAAFAVASVSIEMARSAAREAASIAITPRPPHGSSSTSPSHGQSMRTKQAAREGRMCARSAPCSSHARGSCEACTNRRA
eukprot:1901510-Pleurochrysis_carterae.AAC.9